MCIDLKLNTNIMFVPNVNLSGFGVKGVQSSPNIDCFTHNGVSSETCLM